MLYLDGVATVECAASVIKLADALKARFRITRDRDLEKAIELACCLQVLEQRAVFLDYLESFIYDIEYGTGGYAWGHKCDGLALLAYDADQHGDDVRRRRAIALITSRNFDESDLAWLIENAELELENDAREQVGLQLLEQAGTPLSLTLRERQQGHYSRLVIFAYYHQLLKAYKAPTEGERIAQFANLVERERHNLETLVKR